MIARSWHGRVPTSKAGAYYRYLLRTGLADYRATPGNRGVYVFRRTEGAITHFVLTTFWESFDAIRAFAGADYERARYYPEDDEYLLEREKHVTLRCFSSFRVSSVLDKRQFGLETFGG